MKRFLLLFMLLLPLVTKGADSCLVYVLSIDSEIHAKSARTLEKALEEAKKQNACVFLMRLNTFGGLGRSSDITGLRYHLYGARLYPGFCQYCEPGR